MPDLWREPVEGAEFPVGTVVGDWIAFGDAQTGKLDIANGRTTASIDIVEKCERRDRATVIAVTKRKRFLGVF